MKTIFDAVDGPTTVTKGDLFDALKPLKTLLTGTGTGTIPVVNGIPGVTVSCRENMDGSVTFDKEART